MFTHILIPVDDDPGSRRAIKVGVALAKKLGARVTGFHAMMEFNRAGIVEELLEPPPEELQALAQAHADKLFAPLQREAELAGVECDAIAKRGQQAHEAIVAAAQKARCDLIVMASHGRRGIARLVLGSQTQQVLNHTAISVLVVR
ncbi:MAG TPA: universal stress protein [Rhodanobacteraceae bacterium]|jgi:nucleotide-binding universal stress UspA family protein|nr:universal stress protein [Rhodanobacteraceae bacterium]